MLRGSGSGSGSGSRALSAQRLSDERAALIAEASAALGTAPVRVRVRYELRYRGQSFELPVDDELEPRREAGSRAPGAPAAPPSDGLDRQGLDPDGLRDAFAHAHELRYGYRDEDADVEVVNMRASVWGPSPALRMSSASGSPPTTHLRPIVFDREPVAAQVLRGEPPPGTHVAGPALCALPEATLLVPPGWSGEVDEQGTMHLTTRAV
jgi:N-methylhydantoinase A